jgi:hypothetical protein
MQSNKPNRIMEILTTEYKGESFLLVMVSIVIMVVSAYIINGTLVINPDFPVIGLFPTVSTIVFMVLWRGWFCHRLVATLQTKCRRNQTINTANQGDVCGSHDQGVHLHSCVLARVHHL